MAVNELSPHRHELRSRQPKNSKCLVRSAEAPFPVEILKRVLGIRSGFDEGFGFDQRSNEVLCPRYSWSSIKNFVSKGSSPVSFGP